MCLYNYVIYRPFLRKMKNVHKVKVFLFGKYFIYNTQYRLYNVQYRI